jgi:hypothetical protein
VTQISQSGQELCMVIGKSTSITGSHRCLQSGRQRSGVVGPVSPDEEGNQERIGNPSTVVKERHNDGDRLLRWFDARQPEQRDWRMRN